jgi:hypothetical protein
MNAIEKTDKSETSASATAYGGERSREHSVSTLAALGFLAYYITVMWHEVLGHGSVMYMIGVRHFILTSTSMFSPELQFAPGRITLGGRLVLLAGPFSNTVLGLLLYPLFRRLTRDKANLTLRYFLWLLTALNFFLGFAYMFYSGVFGVADFAGAIMSLPHHALLRVGEVVVSTVLCAATVRFFAVSFAEFSENLWRLALVPYVSAALVFCAAGLRNPAGIHIMLISVVPAALTGQAILVFVTPLARRLRVAAPRPRAIPSSPLAIAVALVFVVIVFLTAPGVRFTLP